MSTMLCLDPLSVVREETLVGFFMVSLETLRPAGAVCDFLKLSSLHSSLATRRLSIPSDLRMDS